MKIDKVIQKNIKYNDMLKVCDFDTTDFWADMSWIDDNDLYCLLSNEEIKALYNKDADFIAFRID